MGNSDAHFVTSLVCRTASRNKMSGMLDPTLCRARQRRLVETLRGRRLDAAVVASRPHVYWLTGHWPFWLHEAAAVLTADGRANLVAANQPVDCPAADDVRTFEATWFSTQRLDQPRALAKIVQDVLGGAKHVGVDASPAGSQLAMRCSRDFHAIDEDLHQLRRRKEVDELALMRKAIDCTRAMHERARELVAPGVEEITVYTELHAAAVRTAGEPLALGHLGNDFACGPGGGAPRPNRPARAGEIYVLDLGPAYRGYFADNCRAYAVDKHPTDVQLRVWEAIMGVFPIVERSARPGTRCRDLFEAVSRHLEDKTGKPLGHHLGHGVGLSPHEGPHVNPKWDDVLEAGNVFTIEPGVYGPEINGGIRLENQYLVTEAGVENLTPFPMELA